MENIIIPNAVVYAPNADEQEAARRRKELRERLLRGEEIKVTPRGEIRNTKDRTEDGIVVPPGKLASFYWYESDPDLFEQEKRAMARFFPQFTLERLNDGRMSWHGQLITELRAGGRWYLQAIYDHNHPHNSTFGGSVKVYSIEPDLADIMRKLGESIPHVLRDSAGNVYLCTARRQDVRAGNVVTSAASSLSWAVKWIAAFEMWMAGDLSTSDFNQHRI